MDLLHCSRANRVRLSCDWVGLTAPVRSFSCNAPIAAIACRTAGSCRPAWSTMRCQKGESKYPASCGAECRTKNCNACCSCRSLLQGKSTGSVRTPLGRRMSVSPAQSISPSRDSWLVSPKICSNTWGHLQEQNLVILIPQLSRRFPASQEEHFMWEELTMRYQ